MYTLLKQELFLEVFASYAQCERWQNNKDSRLEQLRGDFRKQVTPLAWVGPGKHQYKPQHAECQRCCYKYASCYLLHNLSILLIALT